MAGRSSATSRSCVILWNLLSFDQGIDLGPWQPGFEVWGWKAQAERAMS